MESETSPSFWARNAHLTAGLLVVVAAAVALTTFQVRGSTIRRDADAAIHLAGDVGTALADQTAQVAVIALHQKMLGAIDATMPSPRVVTIRDELDSLGLLATAREGAIRSSYTAALLELSSVVRSDAAVAGIRIQQIQMGIIAGAAIVLILLIRNVAVREQASQRPRRVPAETPVEVDPLTGLGAIDTVRRRLGELLGATDPGPGFVGLLIVGIQPEHERFLPLTREQLDATLAETSRRLLSSVRTADVVARLARDELAVVMPPSLRIEDPGRVAGKLLAALDGPLELQGDVVRPNPRVGVAIAPVDAVTPDGLIQRARLARQAAGNAPAAAYRAYRDPADLEGFEPSSLLADLEMALESDDGQLWVAYQPKLDLDAENVVGFEALARWDHPQLGGIAPAVFVRAAEQNDMIHTLGAWVFDKVCSQLAAWSAKLSQLVPVSVNVSERQIEGTGLADLVRESLERHQVPAALLELELSEAILLEDRPDLTDTLDKLSELGVKLAVDGFSTNYSLLTLLKRFPIDILKIDRTFIREIDAQITDRATSSEIIETAHSMSLRVVAEGVETPEQLSVLRTLGCDAAQGYYFARPASPAEIDCRATG